VGPVSTSSIHILLMPARTTRSYGFTGKSDAGVYPSCVASASTPMFFPASRSRIGPLAGEDIACALMSSATLPGRPATWPTGRGSDRLPPRLPGEQASWECLGKVYRDLTWRHNEGNRTMPITRRSHSTAGLVSALVDRRRVSLAAGHRRAAARRYLCGVNHFCDG
jgi:hypothetical protein